MIYRVLKIYLNNIDKRFELSIRNKILNYSPKFTNNFECIIENYNNELLNLLDDYFVQYEIIVL